MVDTSIIMQAARTPNVSLPDILQRSAESAAAIESLPLRQEAMQLQNQQAQMQNQQRQGQIDQDEIKNSVRKAKLIYDYATQLKSLPMEQRRTFLTTIPGEALENMGYDSAAIRSMPIDDASIDTAISQLAPIVQQGQEQVTSRRSESLAGGRITVQELSDGSIKYLEYGEEIPPEQVKDRVANAQKEFSADQRQLSSDRRGGALGEELKHKPLIAAETTKATESQKDIQEFISEAVPQLTKITNNIANYDSVLAELDAGARTGTIYSKLPSINEASKSLDNLRNRLGLDVVSMATFGALSEGELKIALDTALPTNKSPEGLRKWVTDKKNAQQKAADSLRDAVAFLNNGGTMAELVELGRSNPEEAKEEAPAEPQSTGIKFLGFE